MSKHDSLWTSHEVAAATGTTTDQDHAITAVTIDSRAIESGALFVAIAGERFDGHDFATQALEQGAAETLVHRTDRPGIRCADTFKGLEDLARASVARCNGQRIAVTGSVGKTGTKELLAAGFSALGATHATKGNLNNHFGLPLTLANMPRSTDTAVLELGMSAPGEIRTLTTIAQPHLAIITAIAAAHSEFFASEAEIANAKAEIFEGLLPGGIAIYPADSPHSAQLKAAAEAHSQRVYCFGQGGDAELISTEMLPSGGQRITARLLGTKQSWEMQLLGAHWANNALAVALSLALLAPDQLEAGLSALATVPPLKGRGLITQLPNGITVIDETYNASPAALAAAIRVAGEIPTGGRRVAILGDMLELGETGPAAHAATAPWLKDANFDLLLGCGPLSAETVNAAQTLTLPAMAFDSSAALAPQLGDHIRAGDLVLVKGSFGSKMALIVEHLSELP